MCKFLRHRALIAEYDKVDQRIYATHNKVISVINSCNTVDQLTTAYCWAMRLWVLNRRMLRLASDRLHENYGLDYILDWHRYHKSLDRSNDAMMHASVTAAYEARLAVLKGTNGELTNKQN